MQRWPLFGTKVFPQFASSETTHAALFYLQQILLYLDETGCDFFSAFIYLISQMQSAICLLICWLSAILSITFVALMLTGYCIVNINRAILKKKTTTE